MENEVKKVLMLRPGRTEPSRIHPVEVQNYLAGGYTFYELPAEDKGEIDEEVKDVVDPVQQPQVESQPIQEIQVDSQEEPKKKKRSLVR